MANASQEIDCLQKRWRKVDADRLLRDLTAEGRCTSPFGEIDGRQDLRGIAWPSPSIFKSLKIENIDFSHSNIKKLLLIDSHFAGIALGHSKAVILCNNSRVANCNFAHARLRTSGSTGNARWENCNFEKADLKGCIFHRGSFIHCSFDAAVIDGIEFGTSLLDSCKIGAAIRKTFFRGPIRQCDLSLASFNDCAFYGATFSDCAFPTDAIHFKQWQASFFEIKQSFEADTLSNEASEALRTLMAVWEKLEGTIVQQVIDRRNLVRQYGASAGQEIFAYMRKYA